MKQTFFYFIALILMTASCSTDYQPPVYSSFDQYPVYTGTDLELTYTPKQSKFRVWTPTAHEVVLRIYDTDSSGKATRTEYMKPDVQGTWIASLDGDWKGKYYTFQVRIEDRWYDETPGIYAIAVGINGRRAMIVDLAETNPDGWANDVRPTQKNYTDIVLYELHVRDLSKHPQSGIKHKGKFLGLAETGTKTPDGLSTGLDHIAELGVTHVHLLPSFDFRSIDESVEDNPKYNWGYDPQNYNVPEGSYATNASDGNVRIREFKQMVQAMHKKGLRVVMDVVYNHTGYIVGSNFNQLVPKYYYRLRPDSSFSDASACGNETASERAMVRKYIVESVLYWAKEYHVDGFRFDLMGIHDIETMNMLSDELHKIDSTIFIYGEGWTAGDSPLPHEKRALKNHARYMRPAVFSDNMRDALKGGWTDMKEAGFIGGDPGREEGIKFGVVASTYHPQVNYSMVHDSAWADEPHKCINYVSCHDNHTLWDRHHESYDNGTPEEHIKMQMFANAVVLTSQGVPFLHAGEEFCRTKGGEGNSYKSPDTVNQIDWTRKSTYKNVVEYYKNMIALRRQHPAFRMTSSNDIRKYLKFLDVTTHSLVAYQISDNANGDTWKNIVVIHNGNHKDVTFTLPDGQWTLVAEGERIDQNGIGTRKGTIHVPEISTMILIQQ